MTAQSGNLGATALAKFLGISRERVYQLTRSGKIARESDGKYSPQAVQLALKRNLDIRQPSPSRGDKPRSLVTEASAPDANAVTLAAVQLQHEIARAAKAQMELKRLRGTLLEKSEVQTEWSKLLTTFKNKMLYIPAKLARKLAPISDDRECRALIESEIREALSVLSEYEPDAA